MQRHRLRRRQFIALLGGAAVGWPLAVRAQHPNRVRQIGVFLGLATSPDDPGVSEILRPFKAAMQDAGWIDGRNIRLDYRFGGGDVAKINAAATELVTLAPELIYATGLPPVQALRQRTRAIPIVFSLVADPVGFGLVESLNSPGGNITGFVVWDLSIGGKWLQLLQEIAPDLKRIGIMYNPDTAPYAPPLITSAKGAATRNVAVAECPVRNEKEIEAAASLLASEPHGGLLIIPEPFTNAHRDQIIATSARFQASHHQSGLRRRKSRCIDILYFCIRCDDAAARHLHRSNSAGRIAAQPSGAGSHQIRVVDQPQGCQCTRPECSFHIARPRRPSDRVSAVGTSRT